MSGPIRELLAGASPVASSIISIAIMLAAGYAVSRLTRLARLPNVTGYILAGILIGPFCLDLIPQRFVAGAEFLPDTALAFIAFGTGEYFKLASIRKNGVSTAVIALTEVAVSFALVFALTRFALGLSLPLAVLLAALATSTTPTSTVMTIRQTGARGEFVDTLLQVIAIDDMLALLCFSAALSFAAARINGGPAGLGGMALPLLKTLASVALGGGAGWLMDRLLRKRTGDNRLIVAVAMLFAFCGVCALFDTSPLLGCIAMGAVYSNTAENDDLFKQLNYFTPPILLLFFVRSGVAFDIGALLGADGTAVAGLPLLLVGGVYLAARMAGKYLGALSGSALTRRPGPVRNWLGLALMPQTSIAIALSALAARTIGGEVGRALGAMILATSVVYELVGPVLAKLALWRSHSYSDRLEDLAPVPLTDETGRPKTEAEVLIARIREIRKTLPAHEETEEERAFTSAANEQYAPLRPARRFGIWRR